MLVDSPPAGPGWVYEHKYDGIRCFARKRGGRVDLRSRNDLDLNERFASVRDALAAEPAADFVVDGEVVVFDAQLVSRFHLLGDAAPTEVCTPPIYMAFDVLTGRPP